MHCTRFPWFLLLAASVAGVALGAPDEELLGKAQQYPVGTPKTWFLDESVRVGSFSHLDQILPHHVLKKPPMPMPLGKATVEPAIKYRFGGQDLGIDDYLQRERVTGLLVIKDGEIQVERYQYDRHPDDRMVSHSMAKSITSLAVGLALQEGKIKSLDDRISQYAGELAECPYGDMTIRHALRMSSGVQFRELYDGKDDLARFGALRASKGLVTALRAFTERETPEGEKFHYTSVQTEALGVLLRSATGEVLSDYVAKRIWQPMGAEADATWIVDSADLESAAGRFNAVLRDYGRLGVLLANDGALGGKQILPKEYLVEATDWHQQPEQFAPGKATPTFGYGYQFWLLPGVKRRFALIGVYGQCICVDPELKLVMVQTAVAKNASVGKEAMGAERIALWRGIVGHYGSWD